MAKLPSEEGGAESKATTEEFLTSPGSALGTVAYMSPEQARGEDLDVRTDLFSFGVVLYEMATGQQAFTGNTSAVIFEAILNKAPTSPVRLNPDLPEDLERIINKALEKDRDLRYQHASELRADLKRLRRESDSGRTPVAAEAPVPPKPTRRWMLYAVAAAAVIAISAMSAYLFLGRGEPIDSIAVLPFVSTSDDPEIEILSDGITEDLINNLTQLSNLRVAPRSRVFRFKGMEYDEQKAAEDLNVRAILMGKIDAASIQVDLVDVDSLYQLWGWRYNLQNSTLPIIREDIQRNVAEKLHVQLTDKDRELLAKRYTEDTGAYQDYWMGRHHMNKRTEEGFQKGIEYFEQAIKKDPGYALAYSGIADCYTLSAAYGWVALEEILQPAKDAAQKSFDLDPELAEAHASLGLVALNCLAYSLAGKRDEALTALQELMELEKDRFVDSYNFVVAYIGLGDQENAIRYLQKSIEARDFISFPSWRSDETYDGIRADPRFQEIIRKLNLPQ